MAYFRRVAASAFRASEHVSGAWNTAEQHVAPTFGLLAHLVEADRDARRDDGLQLARLSYDILGTLPVDVVDTSVEVLRPGRSVELVEASLCHGGRRAVVLRAWLLAPRDTATLAATDLPRIPPPQDLPAWDPTTMWPGGFIASLEVRRQRPHPGRAVYWVRTRLPLLADEPTSRLAAAVGLLDAANGMAVRVSPRRVAFPNLDLTAHFFGRPQSDWVGFDTSVSFGAGGLGLTSTTIHDETGPIGTMAQALTLRPT